MKAHAAVWPTVLERITESNIRNYSIFLRGGQLFAYFEYVGDDFEGDMARMAADPETQRWWDWMMPMQEPLADRPRGVVGDHGGGIPFGLTRARPGDTGVAGTRSADGRGGPMQTTRGTRAGVALGAALRRRWRRRSAPDAARRMRTAVRRPRQGPHGHHHRVATIGGAPYEAMYDSIAKFEEETGANVEIVFLGDGFEIDRYLKTNYAAGTVDFDVAWNHTSFMSQYTNFVEPLQSYFTPEELAPFSPSPSSRRRRSTGTSS